MNYDTVTTILIILLIIFFAATLFGIRENSNFEKEAIRRGYATYNQQGKFIWKEQKK